MATQKNKIKIVIADDHQIFIEGIKALIKDADNVLLVGEAVNGEQLLHLLDTKDVNVVLMDVYMPKMSGIEATLKIKLSHPDVKVLGLTMMEDAKHISEMMK